jgi:putative tryptophan/tyrosine transport system substrate-binding protein
MRRRDFIAGLGAAAAWPPAARAQQRALPVIGFLSAADADFNGPFLVALKQGLADGGYQQGRNVEILFRYAEYRFDRLPALAAELVRGQVAVIVASGAAPSLAAKAATATIPVVFEIATDPVTNGLVPNLNRPGGNMTGVTLLAESFYTKGIELLHELLPSAKVVALLRNPSNPAVFGLEESEDAAQKLGLRLAILGAGKASDIDQVFGQLARERIDGILINSDRLFLSQYGRIATLAVRYRVPAIFWERKAVEAGGFMSYGASLTEAHRVVGNYAARILKGDKPGDLPVQRSTRIEMALNLKTAKALGLDVPVSILLRADEVIE